MQHSTIVRITLKLVFNNAVEEFAKYFQLITRLGRLTIKRILIKTRPDSVSDHISALSITMMMLTII